MARKLALALAESKTWSDVSGVRVGEYLDDWLESIVKPSVRPRSYVLYELHVRRYLKPALGTIKLVDLAPRSVQQMMAGLAANGLAPTTIRSVRGTLRTALNQAQRWGMVSSNAAALATPPRVERDREAPLDAAQAQQLLEQVRGDRLEALYVLALTMGMRQGELLGLRWSDVDFEARTLSIRQIAYRIKGGIVFSEPKTERSRRTLRIPTMGVAALTAHREQQAVQRELAGTDWQNFDLVFPTSRGTPLDGPNVTRYLQRHLASAGLPKIRFHDLRHACATFLLSRGVDIQVVREVLGHTHIATTADLYAHVLASLKDEAASEMDQLFGPNPDDSQ